MIDSFCLGDGEAKLLRVDVVGGALQNVVVAHLLSLGHATQTKGGRSSLRSSAQTNKQTNGDSLGVVGVADKVRARALREKGFHHFLGGHAAAEPRLLAQLAHFLEDARRDARAPLAALVGRRGTLQFLRKAAQKTTFFSF